MAIDWELYQQLRRLHLVEKLSQRAIAKLLGVTPHCVTSWCRAGYLMGNAERLNGRWVIKWSELMMSSLPVIGNKIRSNGDIKQIVGRRGRGRPPGSKNKNPYPKIKRPWKRKNKEQSPT